MIPVLSSEQIRDADSHTISHKPIASIDLMEAACDAFCSWFYTVFSQDLTISIVCGPGNNGGDGLGIARLLQQANFDVVVYYFSSNTYSEDFKINLDRFEGSKISISESGLPEIESDIIIDAIFGSGLNREADGLYEIVIKQINEFDSVVVAVDIPSGLLSDRTSSGAIVNAHFTVSFQVPKLAFFMPENDLYVGDWEIVNIGLTEESLSLSNSSTYFLEDIDFVNVIPARPQHSHKGSFGHAVIAGGSKGKMGAVVMASRAALRMGTGLLTTIVPKIGLDTLQIAVPEAMTSTEAQGDNTLASFSNDEKFDAIGVGPGMGTSDEALYFIQSLLATSPEFLVIDADGLNVLALNRELLSSLPENTVLTPHPGEFKRLVGDWRNDFERLDLLRSFCTTYHLTVALKGAFSTICSKEGKVFFNPSGNPGMATGGSGDVLTGMLTGLLSKTKNPLESVKTAVYLHGLAGDLASLDLGEESLLATDIIEYIPEAIRITKSY